MTRILTFFTKLKFAKDSICFSNFESGEGIGDIFSFFSE